MWSSCSTASWPHPGPCSWSPCCSCSSSSSMRSTSGCWNASGSWKKDGGNCPMRSPPVPLRSRSYHAQLHPARGPVERGEHGPPDRENEHDVPNGAEGVPRQTIDHVEAEVVPDVHPCAASRVPCQGGTVGEERPEPELHHETVEVPAHEPEGGEPRDPGPPRSTVREQSREGADPPDGHHLERQPGPEPADEDPAREHPDAPQQEPEPRPEGVARHQHDDEERAEAGDEAWQPERDHRGAEHTEQRDRLRPEPTPAELEEQERQQDRTEGGDDPRSVPFVVLGRVARDRREDEWPEEGEQPDHVREDQERDPHAGNEDRASFAGLRLRGRCRSGLQPELQSGGH